VDFSTFNRKFVPRSPKKYVRAQGRDFYNLDPKIIIYLASGFCASREGRARQIAPIILLLISFPFDRRGYAARVPALREHSWGIRLFERHPTVKRVRRVFYPACAFRLTTPRQPANELERPNWPVQLARAKIHPPCRHLQSCLPSEEMPGACAKLSHAGYEYSGRGLGNPSRADLGLSPSTVT